MKDYKTKKRKKHKIFNSFNKKICKQILAYNNQNSKY